MWRVFRVIVPVVRVAIAGAGGICTPGRGLIVAVLGRFLIIVAIIANDAAIAGTPLVGMAAVVAFGHDGFWYAVLWKQAALKGVNSELALNAGLGQVISSMRNNWKTKRHASRPAKNFDDCGIFLQSGEGWVTCGGRTGLSCS